MIEYHFFWDGIFSNFYPINGNLADTSEKIFMLEKAYCFQDDVIAEKIKAAKSPMECKRLGRKVKGFYEDKWDIYKIPAMIKALEYKFQHCLEFQDALKNSKGKILVEASPYDAIWGIGFDKDNALNNKSEWGQNLLGKCLMDLRERKFDV